MNVTLYTGPDPSANIEELFRRTSLNRGDVCALVPDNRTALAMQKRLAASGGAFLGHRIYTLDSLCLDIIGEEGSIEGIVSGHVKRALIAEIIKSRMSERSHFSGIARYPGFNNLVLGFLEEVRSRADGRVSSDPDLVSIAYAYDSHLKRIGHVDHEKLVFESLAGTRIETFASRFKGPLIIDGFYDFNSVQSVLIERLMASFSRCAATLVLDLSRKQLFAIPLRLYERYVSLGARTVDVPPSVSAQTCSVLDSFMGGEKPSSCSPDIFRIHTFRNESAEADWVAGTIRAMLDRGECRPENIMIVSRHQRIFGDPLERALRRHGIPVEDGFPRPFKTAPLVRLILDALEVSVHPDREYLMERVRFSNLVGDPSVKKNRLMEFIDERGWSCRIADVDTPEGFCSSLAAMLEDLHVQENMFCAEYGCEPDEMAVFERVHELLDDFTTLYSSFAKMMRAEDFLRLFRQFVSYISLKDRPSKGRGIIAVDVNHARYLRRDVVFIIGADDSSFPARDGVFTLFDRDIEREVKNRRKAEEPLLFYMSAYGARRLFITFPGIDDEGRDNSLSPYAKELRDTVSQWSQPLHHPAIAGAEWEQGVVNTRGAGEHVVRALKTRPMTSIKSVLSAAGEKDTNLAGYVDSAFTSFASLTSIVGIDVSERPYFTPPAMETVFPVTALEMFHTCPVGYFIERMLEIQIDKRVPGEIDPASRGTVVHEVLARFYRERIDRYGTARFDVNDLPECRELMKSLLDTVYAQEASRIGNIHAVTFLAEKRFLLSWLNDFLETEAHYFETGTFHPAELEISFGKKSDKPGKHYPALVLGAGEESVMVSGRIDRIDVSNEGGTKAFRIIDYKTGAVSTGVHYVDAGVLLQIPLYVKAAKMSIFPEAVRSDGYYYALKDMRLVTLKANKRDIETGDWEQVIDLAETRAIDAVQAIRRGVFPYPDKKCAAFCAYSALCRGGKKDDDT